MRLIKQLGTVLVVGLVGSQAVAAAQGVAWLTVVLGALAAAAMVGSYAWVVRRTERRAPVEVARAGAVGGVARGLLVGGAMCGVVVLAIACHGALSIDGIRSVPGAIEIVGFMVAAATVEEVIFRGVLFRVLEERAGTWLAMLLTGSAFGVMHLLNPDATLWGAIAISISAGFMLAACFAATRTLWVPIGVHLGWNVATGGLFSVAVSGNGTSNGLLDSALDGPALVTGGAFGPEGSVYTVAVGVAVTAAFLWMAHRRGTLVPRGGHAVGVRAAATVSS